MILEKQASKLASIVPRKFIKYLELRLRGAGYGKEVTKKLFNLSCISTIALTLIFLIIYLIIQASKLSPAKLIFTIIFLGILALIIFFIISWAFILIFLTLRIYKRTKQVEAVLGDYLQLVAANVESGMTIEQSLWYAIRPKFGILAKEIETVAKKTMSGADLKEALLEFANSYNSDLLKRSIRILIEGLEAGGKLAELLNKISWNIKETQIMRKQIASSVTTYSMFIAFASMLAAPFLYALSYNLIKIMTTIMGRITIPETAAANLPLKAAQIGLTAGDFRIFAFICLAITALFSSIIVATVKKGSAKAGFKNIPIYLIIVFTIFLIMSAILSKFLGGMIQ